MMRNVFISAEVIFYIWILNSEKSWTPKYILAQGFDYGYAMCYVSDVLEVFGLKTGKSDLYLEY